GHAPLVEDLEVDVAIVGAGITGLSLAMKLQAAGFQVAVLDRDRVASGCTGRSTGHLSTSPDADVQAWVDRFGEDDAAAAAGAMREAVEAIDGAVAEHGIDCDFARTHGTYFAATENDVGYLQAELRACERVGVAVEWVSEGVGLPFPVSGAIRFDRQAQIDPWRYAQGLARAVVERGAQLFEGTRVEHVGDDGDAVLTVAGDRTVRARDVVLATHTPLGVDPLQTAVAPYRSYAIAFRPRTGPPEGLFWDTAEPYHYVRPAAGGLCVVGGDDHKTGAGDPKASYASLERWVRERFDVDEITHRWSAQVYEPVDGLPFVGRRATSQHVWVATGFSGDGLVWGTVAAAVLAARLQDREHPLIERIDTRRFEVRAGGAKFAKENLDVAKHFVGDRLASLPDQDRAEALAPGEGLLVRRGSGVVAASRGDDGTLHLRDAICPHLKCVVQWNGEEGSWDCPCHGARYAVDGRVIEGPSTQDLPESR
ncbi:MAG TPA: FAD-dependent oxidoreductase, partial [Polyangiaceae bacterium LLY-WYZ-14_1]|nr:FAD-dependent oxidoreductase [Polyangiaceae bacterium LLY-WYZ-14_1]